MAITMKDLEGAVALLNRVSKRHYLIDGAYGGYKLVAVEGNGEIDIGCRGTKTEVYYVVQALIRYRREEDLAQ